jgi:hypothetical protein
MRCVHRLRKLRFLSSSFRLCMLSLLTGPAESSRGALRHPGFGLSARAPRLHPHRLPSRLTSRSSRRRVVASLKLPDMRAILATNRRVRRGLTPALGGRKAFDGFAFQCSFSRLRLALLFGLFLAALLLRSSPSGALTHRMRYVGRLRKRCLVSASAPLLTLPLLTGPAESSRVRARAFPPRLSASASGHSSHRHPPLPNNSFKPTPCRGVGRVHALR